MGCVDDDNGSDEVRSDNNNNKPMSAADSTDSLAGEVSLSLYLRFPVAAVGRRCMGLPLRWRVCSPGLQPALVHSLPGP